MADLSRLGEFINSRGINVRELLVLLDEYIRNTNTVIITDEDDMEQNLIAYFETQAVSEFRDKLLGK